MRFPIPAHMDTPESVSLPPANQFLKRIRQDLAHGRALFEVEPGVISWNRLRKKVNHASDSHGIRVNEVVLRNGTVTNPLQQAWHNILE